MAARLLQDHGQEGTFQVRLDNMDFLERVAVRLRESGCEVSVDRVKMVLEVCPLKPNDRIAD